MDPASIYGIDSSIVSASNVNYIDRLERLLAELGISIQSVCLLGTSSLAALGVVENGDIDLLTYGKNREKFINHAKSDRNSSIINRNQAIVERKFDLLKENRLLKGPYFFDISDHQLVNNKSLHFEVDGFKFMRPELVLSMKGVKRRNKDFDHLEKIESSGIMSSDDWDWPLVQTTPPWERTDPTDKGLIHDGIYSLKKDGVITTWKRTLGHFNYQYQQFADKTNHPPFNILRAFNRGKRLSEPIYTDIELRYPLPNLIARQYTNGKFVAFDIVSEVFRGCERLDSYENDEIIVTPSGKIASGRRRVALEIANWLDELPEDASNKSFEVEVSGAESNGMSSIGVGYTPNLDEYKSEFLIQTGAAFHAILWPATHSFFDEIEKLLDSKSRVIRSHEYTISDDFGDFVRQVYAQDERNQKWIRENKIFELNKYDPIIRVASLEIPNPSFNIEDGELVSKEVFDLKMEMRQEISGLIDEYEYGTGIHMTDNFDNNVHISSLIDDL